MEDILIALIQGFFELLNLFLSDLWSWPLDFSTGPSSTMAEDEWPLLIGVLYFAAGLGLGWASLHLWHDVVLRRGVARILAFFLSPALGGWMARQVSRFFAVMRPSHYFWWAFFFDLGICLVRFGYCHRPV